MGWRKVPAEAQQPTYAPATQQVRTRRLSIASERHDRPHGTGRSWLNDQRAGLGVPLVVRVMRTPTVPLQQPWGTGRAAPLQLRALA